ncbi:unnamed protein product [Hermetia illucens]|uniref:DNA-directed RNA polymerase III subunit n=1 Tax=Hermetia illucens TaxID=343691 RepID=A0A7R8UI29_HERIL|nr:DNA-directed RNA polymerase III subunit RPC7 [Hermetia illucens]CAD7080964.1 unnamed protein product [Hermetia illucens]
MAGRGRGRLGSSLTQEQLQVLGCVGKDIPSVPTAPPPTFPPLLSKPVPLENSTVQDYMTLWKEDFLTQMRDSPYHLEPAVHNNSNIQRYSDQFVNVLENSKQKSKVEIPWHLMPAELRPNWKRRKVATAPTLPKKKKENLIEDRLKVLEQKEKIDENPEKQAVHGSDSEEEKEEEEPEIDEDDEMDEENDYGNNYFDNGEAFNEEDDNLDDGPIY